MSLGFSSALIAGAVLAASTLAHAATPVKSKNVTTKVVAAPVSHPNQFPGRSTPIRSKSPIGISDDTSIPTSTLAFLEVTFTYCESIDPKSAPQYAQLLNVILTGTPAASIKAEEATQDYAAQLAALDAHLKSANVASGLSLCRSALP